MRTESFEGKVAVVTGGASGIARALGAGLAAQGAHVVLADLDREGADAAAAELASASKASVHGVALDVRDREAVIGVVDDVVARHGRLDLMVNNAGIALGGQSHLMPPEHWDRVIDVNLRGVVNGVLAAYPRMVAQGDGHLVNVASMAGLAPTPLTAAYTMTKHGVVGLSTTLRPEAAMHGVRVTVVCPGAIETPILDKGAPADLVVFDADYAWKVDRDETTNWATPLVVDYKGRKQLIVNGLKRVRSYDLKTGEVIWACAGLTPSAIPSPVSDGKNVYCMSGFLGTAAYAYPLDSMGDLTEADRKNEAPIAWKRRQPGTPYVPSPLLDGELLYFTASNKGILSCLNAQTGEPLIDRQRITGLENIYASPVAAADKIYLTSREGNTVVIKRGEIDKGTEGADSAKGKAIVMATNKLDDTFDASAAIVGDAIFLRGRENLYCIEAAK